MTRFLFPAWPTNSIPVIGETAHYPVHRIFCVGRNYAAHAEEMGAKIDREAPFYFMKSASALAPTGSTIPYPPGTDNLHHEMELAVAIGKSVFRAEQQDALAAVYGFACALDMTRRDLQQAAKSKQRPWDTAKNFENSAILAAIGKVSEIGSIGAQRIHLAVNGETRQDAHLSDMVWKVGDIISDLSHFYHLGPGDIILTGTPAGVGPVVSGDIIEGRIDGLDPVSLTIGLPE